MRIASKPFTSGNLSSEFPTPPAVFPGTVYLRPKLDRRQSPQRPRVDGAGRRAGDLSAVCKPGRSRVGPERRRSGLEGSHNAPSGDSGPARSTDTCGVTSAKAPYTLSSPALTTSRLLLGR